MRGTANGAVGAAVLVIVSVGLAGCSGEKAAALPAAPSAATIVAGATVSASRHDGASNNSGPNTEVEIAGTASAVSGTCPTIHLMIAGRSVSTSASTLFKGVACAGVVAGQIVEAKGTTQSDGSVLATRIQVEDEENDRDNELEVHGTIAAETGTCPTLTLTVGTTLVHTTAATVFHDGACSTLLVGTTIEAKGTKQSDGSLLASRIERSGDDK